MTLAQRQAERLAATLTEAYGHLEGGALLGAAARDLFPGRLAVVASFGAESAILLSLVAEVDPALPVVFLDTGQHFPETLDYRDRLIAHFGLGDVRSVGPDAGSVQVVDPDATLWERDPDGCCYLRKVVPLNHALSGFDAWVTGRKRYQGGAREALPAIEAAEGRIKVNPLAGWDKDAVERRFATLGLPRHPLEADGYPSIGCRPCTHRVTAEDGPRAGRWAGCAKTECGIHWPEPEARHTCP